MLALGILRRVETTAAFADKLLEARLRRSTLSHLDRSLTQELVLGTIRWRGRIDWVLRSLLDRPLERLTPWIRNILRLGVYQILFLDRIPPPAAVYESVELAKRFGHRGTAGLVNAVLRRVVEGEWTYPDPKTDPVGYLSAFYSHPEWMVERWLHRYGLEETEQLCRANNRRAKISIRVNLLRTSVDAAAESLEREGVRVRQNSLLDTFLEVEEGGGRLFRTDAFKRGVFSVQDVSGGMAVRLLNPAPGERILDMCSAPGGKTTYLAELMQNQGQIVALDRSETRLREMEKNLRRLGSAIVETKPQDVLLYSDDPFDRVLSDVPCSGTGVLARRADARWNRTEGDIPKMARLQLQLLERAGDLVKPGGVIVYSTCTIEPEENEMVVEKFLRAHPDFYLERAAQFLSPAVAGEYLETFPHRHGCDGAFSARIKKQKA